MDSKPERQSVVLEASELRRENSKPGSQNHIDSVSDRKNSLEGEDSRLPSENLVIYKQAEPIVIRSNNGGHTPEQSSNNNSSSLVNGCPDEGRKIQRQDTKDLKSRVYYKVNTRDASGESSTQLLTEEQYVAYKQRIPSQHYHKMGNDTVNPKQEVGQSLPRPEMQKSSPPEPVTPVRAVKKHESATPSVFKPTNEVENLNIQVINERSLQNTNPSGSSTNPGDSTPKIPDQKPIITSQTNPRLESNQNPLNPPLPDLQLTHLEEPLRKIITFIYKNSQELQAQSQTNSHIPFYIIFLSSFLTPATSLALQNKLKLSITDFTQKLKQNFDFRLKRQRYLQKFLQMPNSSQNLSEKEFNFKRKRLIAI
jgi:hypothetical protein